MTRKDYVAIAAMIHRLGTEATNHAEIATLEKVAKGLVPVFKADNRNFSADRFLAACGIEGREGY